jgi:catechol 2,3-dioxygenase-like lactoylglutathione lyase family enzyme
MTEFADPSAPAPAQRRMRLTGLHHVTLICRDLGPTTAFYRDLLGLALVREGTNDDDPGSRHFWFGDERGSPGTLVSFLEYPSMPQGAVGIGSTHHLAFGVESSDELVAWREYLGAHGVESSQILDRGGLRSLYLRDPDGHIIEIATGDSRPTAATEPTG